MITLYCHDLLLCDNLLLLKICPQQTRVHSTLTPYPVVTRAIRIVNRDSSYKVIVFTCDEYLSDLDRHRSVIAITQFDQIEVSFLNRGCVGSFSRKIMLLIIRIDEIVQTTPLPEVRLILQVVAQNIIIFRQVATSARLYPWAQKRRELGARGPALVEILRLLES